MNQLYYQYQSRGLRQDFAQRQQLPDRRLQGFGTHFKDSPPAFIEETKQDNKIERVKKKPKCNKCKSKKNIKEKIQDYK